MRVSPIEEDDDSFMKLVRERIPDVLLEGKDEWIQNWLRMYRTKNPDDVIEYDLTEQTLVSDLYEQQKETMQTMSHDALLRERNRIRILIGSNHRIPVHRQAAPIYPSIREPSTGTVPEWYSNAKQSIHEYVTQDKKNRMEFLTQSNMEEDQRSWTLEHFTTRKEQSYVLEFVRLMTSVWYDAMRRDRTKLQKE